MKTTYHLTPFFLQTYCKDASLLVDFLQYLLWGVLLKYCSSCVNHPCDGSHTIGILHGCTLSTRHNVFVRIQNYSILPFKKFITLSLVFSSANKSEFLLVALVWWAFLIWSIYTNYIFSGIQGSALQYFATTRKTHKNYLETCLISNTIQT